MPVAETPGPLRLRHRRRRQRRAASSPTACPRTRPPGCSSSRPAARTTTSGSGSRSATSSPSTIPRTDWCFKTEAEPGLNGRALNYARGRVLGGCSSINAMIYMRGQRSDYDHWAALGNRGWSWQEVLPYFIRVEDYAHGADELHGAGGELRVEERRVSWEILDAWRDAAAECGIPKIAEFNRGDNFGNAYFQVNQRRGVRVNMVRAFLRPVQHRPNLTVLTDTHARRVAVERGDGGPARHRRRDPARGRLDRARDGAAGGRARCGRHRIPSAPPALRHRPRRPPAGARHPGRPRRCRGSARTSTTISRSG